ncbi:MAG: hypothetical protein ACLGIJ_06100, partial [Candidatus Limnocylindria bacterium]
MSRPRAVILVGSPADPYSRALRLGRTLTASGYDVEIAATHETGLPLEERDGPLRIRRYPASGVFARAYRVAGRRPGAGPASRASRPSRPWLPARMLRWLRNGPVAWWFFPHTVRGWWHTLARELPPADLYHACGTLPIAAALAARERDRRAGRSSVVIFDVIDI